MYNLEKSLRDRRNRLEKQNPSFSSTLLDKIYRSIDEAEPNGGETPVKKQSRGAEEEEFPSLRQACLLDKWMDQSAKEKISLRQRQHFSSELDKKYSMLDHDYDHHDALFFSSGSNSSESSSGGFSSSDTESFYIPKPSRSCFSRPKPIRVRSEKAEMHVIEDYSFNSATDQQTPKSKSRVLRMYGNLKQPISPGGRLASFVNSIFTGNAKKSKKPTSTQRVSRSTCSSASSFSRSCLSKNSPASSQKLCNGDHKRSVQFCPVSVISDKDELKSLYREREELKQMSVSVPSSRKDDAGLNKLQAMEESRRVEEAAKEFLKHYHQTQNNYNDDDDDASCASSDLFELDHLAVIGEKYRDELPVYETTRVDRNRAISNGLYV